ncbi:hypothetical protein WICMUC_001006 [Wickerhamomyces mucosus]|uniref:TATA-binding protein interacting (TIP20) domain-containing protein n=1 Tax=Wickerhamomyces mucosus TaxID=1378264 RepID=A0A9P8TIA4_9ASCO|nr:hypothetical protein WICMUC_001006 [Wickerhamomyces mucosus]
MSTDFKGADQKLKEIVSKSKDVDPDLRFMALNDLNKLLVEHSLIINKVNSYSQKIVNLLLESITDQNSDVQSQALKCFEPLAPSLDDDEILNVLIKLNEKQITINSITTSIHTMAIIEVLKNINLKHAATGQSIINKLLPSFIGVNGQIKDSLDAIETLTELIKTLGTTISSTQNQIISKALVESIYRSQNIISKKSITSLGCLVNNFSQGEFKELLQLINSNRDLNLDSILLTFLTYISLAKANNSLFTPFIDDVWPFSVSHLHLDSDENFEDDQIKIDDIRNEALRFISSLLAVGSPLQQHIDQILNIIKLFLRYDPYTNTSDNDYDADLDEDEDDFGEEYDDLDEGSDDNTWKIRKQSAELTSELAKSFPFVTQQLFSSRIFESILNSIADSSEAVSFAKIESLNTIIDITVEQHGKRSSRKRRGSDVSMADVEDSLTQLNKFRSTIVTKLTKELSGVKQNNINKYNTFLNFFQSFNRLDEDLKPLLRNIREHNFGLNLDLLQFYSSLLQNNDLQYFGDELPYIIEVINDGLTSKAHISVINSVNTAIHLLNLSYNEQLITSIIEIAAAPKNDSELRKTAIESLGNLSLLPVNKVNDILSVFKETLAYEHTVLVTISAITSLVEIYRESIDFSRINDIVVSYKILIRDSTYGPHILDSLITIVRYFNIDITIGNILLEFFNNDQYQSTILKILAHLNLEKSNLKSIFLKASVIEEIDDDALIDIGVKIGSELIPILEENTENQKNIKVIAQIALNENLTNYVEKAELQLKDHKYPAFNIKLLGYIGQEKELNISIEHLTVYFQEDEFKLDAAEALGKIISKRSIEYVPSFLNKISVNEHRHLLLVSIKQVLKLNNGLNFEIYNNVWKTIVTVLEEQNEVNEVNEDLAKICAQNIGYILVNNNDSNYFFNKASELLESSSKSIIYSVVASVKFILAYEHVVSIELIESILFQAFNKISDEDLKIKQIAVITLITSLNNQFNSLIPYLDTILPTVYEELPARKQYQHVLQIGPFKHKVDKALEVRKNSFEILYKLALNHSLLKNVDFNEILSKVVRSGLVNDIISISSLIIIKLLEFDEVLLNSEDKQYLSEGIEKLLSGIKKKEDAQKDTKDEQETKAILINLRNTVFLQQ